MVFFEGLNSVQDRTIFTNHGPISKKPLPILTGNNLRVLSETDVEIPTGAFTPNEAGLLISFNGSLAGRNDGLFTIDRVISSTVLRLRNANFNIIDSSLTLQNLILLANELKSSYNFHRTQAIQNGSDITSVHGTDDVTNIVISPNATNLSTTIALLNEIKIKFGLHIQDLSGDPPVHRNEDEEDAIYATDASSLNSAIILANTLKRNYENHRQSKFFHSTPDTVNNVSAEFAKPITQVFPGNLVGPFNWTLFDPQYGVASNDPADVAVRVNGNPVVVDAVIGQLGAIVLQQKPDHGDDVKVDYSYVKSPPQKFLRLNSPEFNLNQAGNDSYSGWKNHLYGSSSYLIDTEAPSPDYAAPFQPKRVGWKYKAIERAYSAVLNDPTTLLLNVPTNKISFSAFEDFESEVTVVYDPVVLPTDSTDPWTLNGEGTFFLDSSEKYLSITDNKIDTGQAIDPPFFSHELVIDSPSIINAAFRTRVSEEDLVFDGVFTGVGFVIVDGLHTIQVGFLQSEANNLSSAIFLANSIREAFNAHIVADNVHDPDDLSNAIELAPAENLVTLIELSNNLRQKYLNHISKGPLSVHVLPDTINTVSNVDADDLASSILILNSLRSAFNLHRIQPGIHFLDDLNNGVDSVRQIGILTNSGPEEFINNWETFAVDWRQFISYRLFRDEDGNCSLFLSGNVDSVISVPNTNLPNISSNDIDLDSIHQVIFGSISREATSISHWQFIRLTKSPIDSLFIEKNKTVLYNGSVLPELDTNNPWIGIGVCGFEKILSGSLLLDSNGGAPTEEVEELGLVTGAFRGFLRLEPAQTSDTTTSIEFRLACDYFTHSIDNKSIGVVLDDDLFTLQLSFLQFTPGSAQTIGIVTENFSIIAGDTLIMRADEGTVKTVTFAALDITATAVSAKINSTFGLALASSIAGRVSIKSPSLGSSSSFEIIGGSSLSKLGLNPGKYIGTDSNPEPKISWFGDDFLNKKNPAWSVGGNQQAFLFSNTLRISDTSVSDFLVYSQTNQAVTSEPISFNNDWKLGFEFNVRSFSPGDSLPAPLPFLSLDFAGGFVNVDEGPSGKNLEIHLSVDGTDTYLNLVSFNAVTGNLDVISQYAFGWNDGRDHTVNIFTNKVINQVLVFGDGLLLTPLSGPTPAYTTLHEGSDTGPSMSFGSGSVGAANIDMATSRSVCDWKSVSIMRDSKISDPTSADRRYVGLYIGGDPSLLDSYLLHQIDWTANHTYRFVRDPVSAVSLFIDGNNVPVITTSYDALSLPPRNVSYLNQATAGRSIVGFGAFSSTDISRVRWDFVNYSIGKLTQTESIVPPHNLLNQHNVVTSGEHLRTNLKHAHYGYTVYSGGTPQDEFLADERLQAHTTLNEGTPPIPMTQDLESRGGLLKNATLINNIPLSNLINFPGDIANFSNDEINIVGDYSIADLANELKKRFNSHIISLKYHSIPDNVNTIATPDATSISGSISLLNQIKSSYNSHRTQAGVHLSNDLANIVVSPNASDLNSAITLANEIRSKFISHTLNTTFHTTFDVENAVVMGSISSALSSALSLANDIREKYLAHTSQVNVHLENDTVNVNIDPIAIDLDSAILLANSEKRVFNAHRTAVTRETQKIHITHDTVNDVVVADATDIISLTELLISIKSKYGLHLVQSNVHAATVLISIQAPTRVLYDNIKFWKIEEEGDSVPIAPFCDCFEIGSDVPMTIMDSEIFSLPGTEVPSEYDLAQTIRLANNLKLVYNLHLIESGVHVSNDSANAITALNAFDLTSLLILLNQIKAKYNQHLVQTGVHSVSDSFNSSIIGDAINLKTAQALANDLKHRYETHRTDTVMHVSADSINFITVSDTTVPYNPGWQLFTEGGAPSVTGTGTSIIFGTPSSTETIYRHDNVMPRSTSVDFEFSVTMRVNSFATPSGDNYDTRIYAGFTSDMAPGVSPAIGFEFVGGIPTVKIHDMNSDQAMARKIFNWVGAGFLTYKIIRSVATDSFELVIE